MQFYRNIQKPHTYQAASHAQTCITPHHQAVATRRPPHPSCPPPLQPPLWAHLVAVNGVVDGRLEPVAAALVGAARLERTAVAAALLAVLVVRPRPAHARLHVDARAVLQQQLHAVLVPAGGT